jgi:DNA-binding XRE family transcriptional regulator
MTLREAREALALTQHGLDKEADLPIGTTHDLESGRTKSPSHQTAIRITRALRRRGLAGITSEQLFPVPDEAGA